MYRPLLPLIVITCLGVGDAVQGETFRLKDGRTISGEVITKTGNSWRIKLDSGKTLRIESDLILPDEDTKTQPTSSPAEPVHRSFKNVSLPPLRDTFREAMAKLASAGARATQGIVVKVDGKKVYTDLGITAGIREGDELEIVNGLEKIVHPITGKVLHEERDIAATLKVVASEPLISICEVTSGEARETDPSGEPCRVLRSKADTARVACLGSIDIGAGSEVSMPAVQEALRGATTGTGATLGLVSEGKECAYELKTAVVSEEGGCRIILELVDTSSGVSVSKVEAFHRTSVTVADFGFLCAVEVPLGTQLKRDVIRKALAGAFGQVTDAGDSLFVPDAGPRGETAWVSVAGRTVVAGRGDFAERKNVSQIETAWLGVAKTLANVTGALSESALSGVLRKDGLFYTEQSRQFQRVQLSLPSSFSGWVLNWPDATPAWAQAVEGPVRNMFAALLMDDKTILKGNAQIPTSAPLSGITFGEHVLSSTRYQHGTWLNIEAFFPQPNGLVTIYDMSNKPLAERIVVSRSIRELCVPVPE